MGSEIPLPVSPESQSLGSFGPWQKKPWLWARGRGASDHRQIIPQTHLPVGVSTPVSYQKSVSNIGANKHPPLPVSHTGTLTLAQARGEEKHPTPRQEFNHMPEVSQSLMFWTRRVLVSWEKDTPDLLRAFVSSRPPRGLPRRGGAEERMWPGHLLFYFPHSSHCCPALLGQHDLVPRLPKQVA